jgi:hypothetical protein
MNVKSLMWSYGSLMRAGVIACEPIGAQHDRVAVRTGIGRDLGADRAARAGAVVDEHGRVPQLAQRSGDYARRKIGAASRRISDHQPDRFCRIGLGMRRQARRETRQREREQANFENRIHFDLG